MTSLIKFCFKLLNTGNTVIDECEFYTDDKVINHVRIYARPNKWHENDCPYCHKRCQRYDPMSDCPRSWRGLTGVALSLRSNAKRIVSSVLNMVLLLPMYLGLIPATDLQRTYITFWGGLQVVRCCLNNEICVKSRTTKNTEYFLYCRIPRF